MVSSFASPEPAAEASKNVQECTKTNAPIVAADIIRTAEIRMQQKGMLPGGQNLTHNPFWFLVETEKNVFLWRSGCSLVEKDDFDFWVDIDSLLNKRLAQLERQGSNDPFSSALDAFELGQDPAKAETEYLTTLRETLIPILTHLSALSEVQSELIRENTPFQGKRVVLPFAKEQSGK